MSHKYYCYDAIFSLFTASPSGGQYIFHKHVNNLLNPEDVVHKLREFCTGFGIVRVECFPHKGHLAPFLLRDYVIVDGSIKQAYKHNKEMEVQA